MKLHSRRNLIIHYIIVFNIWGTWVSASTCYSLLGTEPSQEFQHCRRWSGENEIVIMVVLSFWELTKITLYNKSYNKRNIKHRYFHYMHHFTRELQDVSNRVDATLNAKGAHAKYWPYFIFIIFVCLFYCLSIFVVLFFYFGGKHKNSPVFIFSFYFFIFLINMFVH